MRVAASLYANKTRRQLFEKCQDAPACQALANNTLSCGINPMRLKDSLCDIQSDDCDRFHCALQYPGSGGRVESRSQHQFRTRPYESLVPSGVNSTT
jgi:hypothetical protein